MIHGTAGGYSKYGCRCPECTAAHRARMREYRKRRTTVVPTEAVATTPGTTEKRPGEAGTSRGMASEATAPMRFQQYPPQGGGA